MKLSVRRPILVAVIAGALLFAACGGSSGGGGNSSSGTKTVTNGTIDVNAKDPFSFDVKTIKAPAGPLTITLHEKGSSEHTFTISALKFEIKVTPSAPTATGTVTLEAGKTYSFKCSFDGHAAAGMVGTIVVG